MSCGCVEGVCCVISNRTARDARLSVCDSSVLFFTLVLFILLCSEIDVRERLC